jgi:hypothetical protein
MIQNLQAGLDSNQFSRPEERNTRTMEKNSKTMIHYWFWKRQSKSCQLSVWYRTWTILMYSLSLIYYPIISTFYWASSLATVESSNVVISSSFSNWIPTCLWTQNLLSRVVSVANWHSMTGFFYAFPVAQTGNSESKNILEFNLRKRWRAIFLHPEGKGSQSTYNRRRGMRLVSLQRWFIRSPIWSRRFLGGQRKALKFVAKELTDLEKDFEYVWVRTSDDVHDVSSRSKIAPSIFDRGNSSFRRVWHSAIHGKASEGKEDPVIVMP